MYLVHLPIVCGAQLLLSKVHAPSPLKFAACGYSEETAKVLKTVSYDFVVGKFQKKYEELEKKHIRDCGYDAKARVLRVSFSFANMFSFFELPVDDLDDPDNLECAHDLCRITHLSRTNPLTRLDGESGQLHI
mgnify:CR=1 FL=1